MALLRLVVVVGVALLVLAALGSGSAIDGPTDQTVVFGAPSPNASRLYTEIVDVKKTMLIVHTRKVSYPPKSSAPVQAGKITYIRVEDMLRTGKNAYVTLSYGGINQTSAVISLKSHRGGPIKYWVQFYGS